METQNCKRVYLTRNRTNNLNNLNFKSNEHLNSEKILFTRYNIILEETLGKGSYSKVKIGYDLKNKRRIAVKIIDFSKVPTDFRVYKLS